MAYVLLHQRAQKWCFHSALCSTSGSCCNLCFRLLWQAAATRHSMLLPRFLCQLRRPWWSNDAASATGRYEAQHSYAAFFGSVNLLPMMRLVQQMPVLLLGLCSAAPVYREDNRNARHREGNEQHYGAPERKLPPRRLLRHIAVEKKTEGQPCNATKRANHVYE